jgi:hypothetical protein
MRKYDFRKVSNVITPTTNFMKIRPAILELLHVYRRTSPEMTFNMADDIITHAQRIMGNGVLIAPPHEFESPSRW